MYFLYFLESAHDKSVQREKERLKLQEATNKELHKLNNNVQEVWHGIGERERERERQRQRQRERGRGRGRS